MNRCNIIWFMVITCEIFHHVVGYTGTQCVGNPLKVTVTEGQTAGSALFKFKQDENIVYTFNEDLYSAAALSIFQITPAGVVTNVVTLDYEDPRGNEFTLTVLAKNYYNGINACPLTISILDLNDNSPKFKNDLYVGYIQENLPKGSLVQGLQGIFATDQDSTINSVHTYKILSGNGVDRFEAITEELDGIKFLNIQTKQRLDREETSFYVLTVQASDGGDPVKTAQTQIRINIEDTNDCTPKFTSTQYFISILSTTSVSTQILKVHANDEDSEHNSEIYYFFKKYERKSQFDSFFTIDPYTGVIRVAKHLDFTSGNVIRMTVVAQDRGYRPKRAETVVEIKLIQGFPSTFDPSTQKFVRRSYIARIREDLPINSHILFPDVVNLERSKSQTKFSISSSQEIPFQVDVNSGFLYLVKKLNFETKKRYEFRLLLTSSVNSAEANITVLIDDADENFNTPVFKKGNIATVLNKQDRKLSHFITKVKAFDPDEGQDGKLNYRIVDGNGIGRFSVEQNTGRIFSIAGVNWENINQLELVIKAQDNGTRLKNAKQFLLITVLSQQDCNPMFDKVMYHGSVQENLPRETFVAVVKAKLCEGGRVEYFITGGNSKNAFKIDQYYGIISTTKSLDREQQGEYTLEITAKKGLRSSKALLVINIDDVNDNDPVFVRKNYQVEITENRGKINSLLCVIARDKDVGNNAKVSYDIVTGNKSLFSINVTSGTLSSKSLNFEDRRVHVLKVRATDHGDPPRSSFTTVEVLVKNVNDPPQFESKKITVTIEEEKPRNTKVKFLPVFDEDVGKNGEFDCSYENLDPVEFGKFRVLTTSSGCEIQNKVLLQWADERSYSLNVRVTDRASLLIRKSNVITVKIKIIDVNNHDPVFLQQSYYTSVSPRTTSILTVAATDEDGGQNGLIKYSLPTNSKIFRINAQTGKLTAVRGKLVAGKYIIDIHAEDHGSPKRKTKVTCTITVDNKVSRHPLRITFTKRHTKLDENIIVDTVVTTVRVNKHGTGIHYSIVGGNIDEAFSISRNGKVRVVKMLDFERVRKYNLVIRVSYSSVGRLELVAERILTITVSDINDNEPRFTRLENPLVVNINRKIFSGSFITKTLAYDADSANTITYTIQSSSSPVPFKINPVSGEITARSSVQSRSWPYSFTVVAEDGGTPRKRSELLVDIRILKGHSNLKIRGDQLIQSVDEGPLEKGRDIVSFSVKNEAEDSLTYSINNGDHVNAFCVDVTGSLYTVKELDRESHPNYVLSISVNDGESSDLSDVHILVNDKDDHRPQFSNDVISIFTDENTHAQKIWTISAKDRDLRNVTYGIVGTSRQSYSPVFAMHHGILMITRTLDHEEAPRHILTIVAENQNSHKTFVRAVVIVRDKNDNAPQFLTRDYHQRVPVNAPRGYLILQAKVTDQDSGLNGQISYTLHPSSKFFTLDVSTGWIRVARQLTTGSFMFNVTAKDHGIIRLSDTVSLRITVEAGDGPPRFLYVGSSQEYHANVMENKASGYKVVKVKAVSKDIVSYGLYQSNTTDFIIDTITGDITTTKPLDYENIKYYELTISATDRNERISLAHVGISVVNINDNKPEILNKDENNEISCRIRRDMPIGSLLTKIEAQDLDNDQLKFSLAQNLKPALFSTDTTGSINTVGSLEDIKDSVYLAVTVMDRGSPVLKDTVTVKVVVVNYGDNVISSSAKVSEDAAVHSSILVSPKISPRYESTQYYLIYPPESPFSIIQGSLSLKSKLDYEKQQYYDLTVRLQQTGNKNNYFDVDIRIEVKDQNDNSPEFITQENLNSSKNLKIHRNAETDSLVYQFIAKDKDGGFNGEIYYLMTRCQDCTDLFKVDRKTGELKTTGVTLVKPEYKITVVAYDKGIPAKSTQTSIIVKADEWKPEFTKEEYHFYVDESANIGQLIGVVQAQGFGVSVTYELRSPSLYFTLNPTTGALTLFSKLDYEKISKMELRITTKNQASSTRVIIHVEDVNDCQPKFDQSVYIDSIPESVPIGSTVLKLHASDDDSGLNADIRYSLDSEKFIVDSYTGVVSTAALLDFENKRSYSISVTAHDRGKPSQMGMTKLVINIDNINDNFPVFTAQEYSCFILENKAAGSDVITVKATDGDGDKIIYDIIEGNDAGLFIIDQARGVVKLTKDKSLNFVQPYYILNISATDGMYSGYCVVRLNITDINDHAPVFTKCLDYHPSIPENSPLETTVLQVSADDKDLGINGQVEYEILQSQHMSKFGIHRVTGRIETKTKFDREQARIFSILVKATDGSNKMRPEKRLEGSCSIDVTITDVNDNYPVFERTSYKQIIHENVPIGHRVIKVKATDIDEGLNSKISYSLKKPSSLFTIDPQTGMIKTKAKLVNKKNRYKLKVLATDHGNVPLFTDVDVIINVIRNKNALQFEQSFYEVSIPENLTKLAIVTRVAVSSQNKDSDVSYRFKDGNTPSTNSLKTFHIDRNGIVRVLRYIDRETVPVYTLDIHATHKESSTSATLGIVLTDVNDCFPEFQQPKYDGTVSENVVAGSEVVKVSAVDDDLNSRTVYRMVGRNKYFSIHPQTGQIQTKQKFDREEKSNYQFQVEAIDPDNPSLTNYALVYVKIADQNDLVPVFEMKCYNKSVKENVPLGTVIGTVIANDGDENTKMTYTIKSGNIDDNFRIDPNNGEVIVKGNIDYEARTNYELILRAWDGKHENTTRMIITIENENDNNPRFERKLYEVFVKENSPKRTLVTNLKATDPDALWIKYELSIRFKDTFTIHQDSGDIKTSKVLDREETDVYTFEAYARDEDGRTGTVKVIVHVLDENDNMPHFKRTSLEMSVVENSPAGTEVGIVTATDLDDVTSGYGKVSYGLVMGAWNDVFTINKDTGQITTRIMLDRENISMFTLTVIASDHGKPPRSTRDGVTITVLDANDHSPVFKQKSYEKTIAEDAKIGMTILQVVASDQDIGENANLSFTMVNPGYDDKFLVDSRSGKIKVAALLDYEKKTEYQFEIKVEDGGTNKLSDKTMIMINITDVNDCSPVFSQTYEYDLEEAFYKNKKLKGKLEAVDEDGTKKNTELWYSIPNDKYGNIFVIDPITGELFVNGTIDFEMYETYMFSVRATNLAYPYLYGDSVVKINVYDVNDNPPKLAESSCDQEILENSDVKGHVTVIGKLYASDDDKDDKEGPFKYEILSGNEKKLFELDPNNGVLTTKENFDREKQAMYILKVSVKDPGTPPLTNNFTVRVHVTDRNDNQHHEGYLELSVNLREYQLISPTVPIGSVFVNDTDTDDQRYYDVLLGDTKTFAINKLTGVITMKKRPASKEYKFRVRVSDRNSSFHPVVCKVKIEVNTIPEEAFSHSITLRFNNMKATEFITHLEMHRNQIAKALNTKSKNVDIYSIQDVDKHTSHAVDIRLAAHGSPYYAPERLISIMKGGRYRLKYSYNVSIGYDACAEEEICKSSAGCSSQTKFTGRLLSLDNGHGKSFVSLETSVKVTCGTWEKLFPKKISCRENPCLNSGNCTDFPGGYLCQCPEQYQGPNCELTTRSFKPGDWVWLRALKSSSIGTLSLEFSTLKQNGLLLYAGPTASFNSGDTYDFLSIQLSLGRIKVKFSLGDLKAEVLNIATPNKLNDGEWHTVKIYHNVTFMRVVIDECNSSLVRTSKDSHKEDRRTCEANISLKNTKFHFLTINDPVQLGGMFGIPPEYVNLRPVGYDGCIRNIKENGIMMDLKDISNSKGSQEGCPEIDKHCPSTSFCGINSSCIASRKGFTCMCAPGYDGLRCENRSFEQTFSKSSFITYQPHNFFLKNYNAKFTKIEMMLRTREKTGGILVTIYDENGFEHFQLRLTQGNNSMLSLEGKINLGGNEIIARLTNTLLGDGEWHHVTMSRKRNEVHLQTNLPTNPKTAKAQGPDSFILLQLTKKSKIVLGSKEAGNGFNGCMKDIRLNGEILPQNTSNNVVLMKQYEEIKSGCISGACNQTKCTKKEFCYDLWRLSKCLPRECFKKRPCLNRAECHDFGVNGVAKYRCECITGFVGTNCENGTAIAHLEASPVNIKLIVGLSCFVLVLVLATLLIVCYHRYQTNGNATFNKAVNTSNLNNKKKPSSKKSLMVWCEENNEPNKTNNLIKNLPSSNHNLRVPVQKNTTQSSLVSVKSHPLEQKPLSQLPAWDIPPMIDIRLSPNSDSSPISEDYIEDPDEIWEDAESKYIARPYAGDRNTTTPEQLPDEIEPCDSKEHAVSWNDIEEYGRKFYTLTKNFLTRDDERPGSGVSTISNSSSVVTVIENPLA